jgi:hypothetical protein
MLIHTVDPEQPGEPRREMIFDTAQIVLYTYAPACVFEGEPVGSLLRVEAINHNGDMTFADSWADTLFAALLTRCKGDTAPYTKLLKAAEAVVREEVKTRFGRIWNDATLEEIAELHNQRGGDRLNESLAWIDLCNALLAIVGPTPAPRKR